MKFDIFMKGCPKLYFKEEETKKISRWLFENIDGGYFLSHVTYYVQFANGADATYFKLKYPK